jgi:hypothetical protein
MEQRGAALAALRRLHGLAITERMSSYRKTLDSRSGSRRLGGPILFQDLWTALRENLRGIASTDARQRAGSLCDDLQRRVLVVRSAARRS